MALSTVAAAVALTAPPTVVEESDDGSDADAATGRGHATTDAGAPGDARTQAPTAAAVSAQRAEPAGQPAVLPPPAGCDGDGGGGGGGAAAVGAAASAPLSRLQQHQQQHQQQEGEPPEEVLLSLELRVTGNLDAVEVLPSAEELRSWLQRAVEVATTLAATRPHVANMDKMARRIRSDLDFVRRCCLPADIAAAAVASADAAAAGAEAEAVAPLETCHIGSGAADGHTADVVGATAAAEVGPNGGDGGGPADGAAGGTAGGDARPLLLTLGRVQGIINNLRGFQGELLAAQLAPGVVGVLRRFQARVVMPSGGLPPSTGTTATAVVAAALGGDASAAAASAAAAATRPQTDCLAAAATAAHECPAATDSAATVATSTVGAAGPAVVVGRKRSLSTITGKAGEPSSPGAADGHRRRSGGGGVDVVVGATRPDPAGVADDGARCAATAAAAAAAPTLRGGGKGGGGKGGGAVAATSVSVEVDVVGQGGHCWIEVKNQEVFGLESVHWTGAARHVKGLRRQVEELLAVAAAPQHHRRWRAPSVVLFFPSGVHVDVRQELTAMGAHVAVGPDSLRHLPPPPPRPETTNLDVTAMCGLVSELSHGGAHDPAVEHWAQRTVHWVECLAAERQAPLLGELSPWLAPDRQLLAADLACRQFQLLLDMFGGPRERERWVALRNRMMVVATEEQPAELSPRCRELLSGQLGRDQLAVFGLGDARRAVTLTANGNAVRGAERQGVALEVVLHRPVWLTGR